MLATSYMESGALQVRIFRRSILRGSISPTYTGRDYAVSFPTIPRIIVSASKGSCPAIGFSASRLFLDLGGIRCVLIARAPLSRLAQRLTFVPSIPFASCTHSIDKCRRAPLQQLHQDSEVLAVSSGGRQAYLCCSRAGND